MVNIFRPFEAIGKFFEKLFGALDGPKVQTVLTDTQKVITLAQPIVSKLGQIARDLPQDKFVQEVEKVIGEYVKDAPKVAGFAASVTGKSTADILRAAGTLALGALVPSTTSGSVLNFAVEMALQILKVV